MNERIKLLAEQCYEHDQSWTGVGQRIFNKEKFAELIVQECIRKIENEAGQYAAPTWAFELVNDIKETFGVEE